MHLELPAPVVDFLSDGTEPEGQPTSSPWSTALAAAHHLALDYLATLTTAPVSLHASPADLEPRFDDPLPEAGCAAEDAVREWSQRAAPGIVRSPGPRYFGFVTGGATPAALAGDWLTSAIDQNAGMWLTSPAAAQTELTVIRWLLELFRLPANWSGALTTGATMANLCGLAAARQWASERLGFDAARDGLGGQPPLPVISSVEIHQSARKALGILGFGRDAIQIIPANEGSIDLAAFDRALAAHGGPAIVIANAGEVNTGAFDPIRALADRCGAHAPGVWLHVDGAFGLYAALAPSHRHLVDGVDLADSVATDAHKWLNVPYDCGIAFVRDAHYLHGAFGGTAAYLESGATPVWNAHEHVPEISRRFRALAVWCALRASGSSGYRDVVERSVANAEDFAAWVATQDTLELMAPVHLNIVCFRVAMTDGDEERHDRLTSQVTETIQRGGVAYVTGTRWRGRVAIRAAFDNWATRREDVNALKRSVASAIATLVVSEFGCCLEIVERCPLSGRPARARPALPLDRRPQPGRRGAGDVFHGADRRLQFWLGLRVGRLGDRPEIVRHRSPQPDQLVECDSELTGGLLGSLPIERVGVLATLCFQHLAKPRPQFRGRLLEPRDIRLESFCRRRLFRAGRLWPPCCAAQLVHDALQPVDNVLPRFSICFAHRRCLLRRHSRRSAYSRNGCSARFDPV